jgi:UDP-hydrolysing UDP-N-acetyl-D-glucosamine 2-epimerase
MRTIGVVTVARSDYGIYRPLLRRLREHPGLRPWLYVGGMHLSPEFGLTVREVEADGFEIAARVEMLLSSDTPHGIAASMGHGTVGFAQAYAARRPDLLLVLGDRFEMHAAAVAAVPFLLPVAHFHGGAVTLGAIDDMFRHSITKLSHLHFAETEDYARRIVQMGEAPWRVVVTGAMALDNLRNIEWLSLDDLNERFGMSLYAPPLLVTFHPVTREYERAEEQTTELLAALEPFDVPLVITYPNADTNGRVIIRLIEQFVARRGRAWAVPHLGMQAYFSLMRLARAMVGNSSSGIIESASFRLPVVNVGSRQEGRLTPPNVLSVPAERQTISGAVAHVLTEGFRAGLDGLVNPYGDGHAADRTVEVLAFIPIDERLLRKGFHDI